MFVAVMFVAVMVDLLGKVTTSVVRWCTAVTNQV
jgi:hypothetical protein